MNLKTGTFGYNNKILVSDEKFSLGENVEVNSLEPAKVIAWEPSIKSYKAIAQPLLSGAHVSRGPGSQATQGPTQAKKPTTHEDEKVALVLSLASVFAIWYTFDKKGKPMSGCSISRFATWACINGCAILGCSQGLLYYPG